MVHLVAHRHHGAGDLVAERHRHLRDPLVGPFVPVVDVQVRSADRGAVDLHEHLTLTCFGNRDLHEIGAGLAGGLAQGAHRRGHRAKPTRCIGNPCSWNERLSHDTLARREKIPTWFADRSSLPQRSWPSWAPRAPMPRTPARDPTPPLHPWIQPWIRPW